MRTSGSDKSHWRRLPKLGRDPDDNAARRLQEVQLDILRHVFSFKKTMRESVSISLFMITDAASDLFAFSLFYRLTSALGNFTSFSLC